MIESKFYSFIRDGLKKECSARHLSMLLKRVENDIGDGTPDTIFAIRGAANGFIELKSISDYPVLPTTKVFGRRGLSVTKGTRVGQVEWITQAVYNGLKCYILAQVGGDVYLIGGVYADKFNEFTKSDLIDKSIWRGEMRNCHFYGLFLALSSGQMRNEKSEFEASQIHLPIEAEYV